MRFPVMMPGESARSRTSYHDRLVTGYVPSISFLALPRDEKLLTFVLKQATHPHHNSHNLPHPTRSIMKLPLVAFLTLSLSLLAEAVIPLQVRTLGPNEAPPDTLKPSQYPFVSATVPCRILRVGHVHHGQ
jgi:hypothetical protein